MFTPCAQRVILPIQAPGLGEFKPILALWNPIVPLELSRIPAVHSSKIPVDNFPVPTSLFS
jgi:hypothetical protein